MTWLQITLEATPEKARLIADIFSATGALTVTFQDAADQPIYEPNPGDAQLWANTTVTGLYQENVDLSPINQRLRSSPALDDLPEIRIDKIGNQEWERLWMDKFQPMRFGKRLWIVPSWYQQNESGAINVILDPGLAFGTGTHATTALCLEWLDQYDGTDKTVIDYGCGSGILAIAAVKLGASNVWAVDNDPQALIACEENARKNDVAHIINTIQPEQLPDIKADCLIANILATPLIELAPSFASWLKAGANIILSGILSDQVDAVVNCYEKWFIPENIVECDGWARICAIRNDRAYVQ